VIGAVENPGYVVITAVDRVKDAIDMTNGVQKYGDNKIVFLERNGFIEWRSESKSDIVRRG